MTGMFVEIALVMSATLLGTMISFIVVISPAVFKTLDREYSQKFLRYIFPRLFNFCTLITIFMGSLFILGNFIYGLISSLLIAISFLINTYFLTPRINMQRDLFLAGDAASERLFKNLHFTSVLLYLLNMVLVSSIFILYYI